MRTKTLGLALGLLSALFIGFVWWVYFTSESKLHWYVPALFSLLPLLVFGALWLMHWLDGRRGARKLEQALSAEGAREQHRASSARSAEVTRLRGEFDRAVTALKGSKLASGQRNAADALYRLPWYAIIGPPASGKTTVLRNSGLKFPYLPGTGDRLKGVGGTRNCDWWLTNQAILLDTAGRWTLEDEDREEWLTFLDLLRRHRGQRPLNGVIAAISIAGDDATSIAGVDLAGVKQLAGRMRERLDEITGQLGVALPVYLLFTKCDLVTGFVETFGALAPDERRQIWGFTAPLLTPHGSKATYFEEQFELLRESLERHALARMGDEVSGDVIPAIYEFPAQLGALKEKLSLFVDELFDDSAYRETPMLRGAYFTSGTQEGAPADLLFEDIANTLDVRPRHDDEIAVEKKSYFLHDMLMKVVFEDRTLATASQTELVRAQKRRRAVTTGLFAAASLLTLLPTLSCRTNLDAIARSRTLLAAQQQKEPVAPRALIPEHVSELAAMDADVARYRAGPPVLTSRLGLYHGAALAPALTRYHGTALREWVLRPLLNANNEKLITITQQVEGLRKLGAELDEATEDELKAALKLHLLLTTPRDGCAPRPQARKEWLVGSLLSLWEAREPVRERGTAAMRRTLLSRYVELESEAGEALALGRDRRNVELARLALGGEDKVNRLLKGVLTRFGDDQRTLAQLSEASSVLSSSRTLSGAFTREAWLRSAQDQGVRAASMGDEDWLFGCDDGDAEALRVARQSAAFEEKYLARYDTHWRELLGATSARAPRNALEAETALAELASRPGALGKLFQLVREHTELPAPPARPLDGSLASVAAGALERVAAAGGKSKGGVAEAVESAKSAVLPDAPERGRERLARSYAEFWSFGVAPKGGQTALDQYRTQVEAVLVALRAYRADDSKIDGLALATRTALDSVDLLLRSHGGAFRGVLREILVPPLAGVANLALSDRGSQVQRLWCELVYEPYQRELAGRYPLQADAKESASLQSFTRFFGPGTGVIASFESTQLASFVTREGERVRFAGAQASEARSLFDDGLLRFLQQAGRVSRAFFPSGAASPRMAYRLRVRGAPGYSVTSFRAGSTSVRYDSGSEQWVAAEWPGEQPSLGATLAVTPYQGAGPRPLTVDGEWGLFRILDPRVGGRVLERGDRRLTVGWKPKGDLHWIKVDFAADDVHAPLLSVPFGGQPQDLLPLELPARIARDGGGC